MGLWLAFIVVTLVLMVTTPAALTAGVREGARRWRRSDRATGFRAVRRPPPISTSGRRVLGPVAGRFPHPVGESLEAELDDLLTADRSCHSVRSPRRRTHHCRTQLRRIRPRRPGPAGPLRLTHRFR